MSRKRKILDILGMILGVLLVIVNGMMVGLEYMYQGMSFICSLRCAAV